MDIKQENTILAYRTEFERLSSQIPDLEPKFLERVFLKGLKLAIRYHIDVLKIRGLSALMDAALKMEKQLHANWHIMRSSQPPAQSVPLPSTNQSFRKWGGGIILLLHAIGAKLLPRVELLLLLIHHALLVCPRQLIIPGDNSG